MSDEKKKAKDWTDWAGAAAMVAFFIAILGIVGWEAGGRYIHGATPAELATVSLEGTPKEIGRALPATEVKEKTVRVNFRVGAARPYSCAQLTWRDDPSAPSEFELVAERSEKDDPHGVEVIAAMSRRFHAMHEGTWSWGRIRINVHKRDGDVDTSVDATYDKKPNPLFERQIDALRQVALEAAFGIAPHASDADLAELLGTGYATADVGKIDPGTAIENVPALMKRFPGALHDNSERWDIAVDQPLLRSVSLHWQNRRGGTLSNVSFEVADAYEASRNVLETCLETKLGPPTTKITDYAADKKNYVFAIGSLFLVLERRGIDLTNPSSWDAAAFAQAFDALGSCKDKSENTGARGDGRKK